jgi:uncharacterized protein YcfJ
MKAILKSALAVTALVVATQAAAEITFYEREDFRGQSFTTDRPVRDLDSFGFNNRAGSAVVSSDRWEVCDQIRFGGRCRILRPGSYPSLAAMGMNQNITSVRDVDRNARFDDGRYAPAPVAVYEAPRGDRERLFDVPVTSVRAVLTAEEKRCWIEREQVQDKSRYNVPGAIVGAVVGGVLGHQIGRGTGRDVATIGGAAAGGAVGANVGRSEQVVSQDVQRCENIPGTARTDYWDVTYHFRGQEHHAQLTSPPGSTILVNEYGEPRV